MELTLLSSQAIQLRIDSLAKELSKKFKNKSDVVFVCVLRGAFMFYTDLVRKLDLDIETEFIQVSSYGNGTITQGLSISSTFNKNIKDRVVVLVDDIVDSGNTFKKLEEIYFNLGAKEVYTVALISRPASSQLVDYYGFQINDEWIFGYGLDWKCKRRTIEDIKYFEHNID
jgi:hypoxanthine phosphoribosyltransferase